MGVYVGPHKTSLANTDRPVQFSKSHGFKECRLEEAIQRWLAADEGFYVELENPGMDKESEHPRPGNSGASPSKLSMGRKINIAGPVAFPLWPGQSATVIQGHNLRSNQYLIVRIYNDEQAKENWTKAIIKQVVGKTETGKAVGVPAVGATISRGAEANKEETPAAPPVTATPPALTMGQLLVIKGTDVSFYIPPTGVEVVPDEGNKYVRDAVTLERLEYCILLAESGEKRFVRGPRVVFPEPTETFVKAKNSGAKKFRAVDLNRISGLYIKVIAPYEEGNRKYKEGDELFITGAEQMIYFPRPEHAIIRYNDQEKHHAIAIPPGEARYVLDRDNGQITLVRGPQMFLPDPRTQVVVRRILDDKIVQMWFPGNTKALDINRNLAAEAAAAAMSGEPERYLNTSPRGYSGFSGSAGGSGHVGARGKEYAALASAAPVSSDPNWAHDRASAEMAAADDINRKTTYSPPRTVSLDTKYEGAVQVSPWTGYAVMIVCKDGKRKVVQGPQTVLLEYDESLEVMELSTGTPKTDETIRTVYLRVNNNKISDVIQAVTKDMVKVSVRVSYRVNFEGDQNRWFNVENYVKFLTDHLRSVLRNTVKQYGIEQFNNEAVRIVRDTVLGTAKEGEQRPGKAFKENGMRVYDVEILDVIIGDTTISQMLTQCQHKAVQQALTIAQKESELETTRRGEDIQQKMDLIRTNTAVKAKDLQIQVEAKYLELRQAQQNKDVQLDEQRQEHAIASEKHNVLVVTEQVARQKMVEDQKLAVKKQDVEITKDMLAAEAKALVEKAGAISPQLTAALQAFGDKAFTQNLMEALGPHALLRGTSVSDVFAQLVAGSPGLGDKLATLTGQQISKQLEAADKK